MVIDVYVVDFKPLGFEFILGINGISALCGVTIFPSLATRFGSAMRDDNPVYACATNVEKPVWASATKVEKPVCAGTTKVEKPDCAGTTKVEKPVCAGGYAIEIHHDFCVSFDATEKGWTVT